MTEPLCWVVGEVETNPDTEEHWRAAQDGRLAVQRCAACNSLRFPPSEVCPSCRSVESTWVDIRQGGVVHSWIVVTHPVIPSLRDSVPYIVALVDLEPGVRMPGRVINAEADVMREGVRVETVFLSTGQGRKVPAFGLAPPADASKGAQ